MVHCVYDILCFYEILCYYDTLCFYDILCFYEILCYYDTLCFYDILCFYEILCYYDTLCFYDILCFYEILCYYDTLCFYDCVFVIHCILATLYFLYCVFMIIILLTGCPVSPGLLYDGWLFSVLVTYINVFIINKHSLNLLLFAFNLIPVSFCNSRILIYPSMILNCPGINLLGHEKNVLFLVIVTLSEILHLFYALSHDIDFKY